MQPGENLQKFLADQRNIRIVQIRDCLWAVNLAPGNRVLFSGHEAEARAYEYAALRANEDAAVGE